MKKIVWSCCVSVGATAVAAIGLLSSIAGCSTEPDGPEGGAEILRRLDITEWDLSAYSGKRIRVSSIHDADRSIEFPVNSDVRFVTQVVLAESLVAVFFLDQGGTSSTALYVGDLAGSLTATNDANSGTLYEWNGSPVVLVDIAEE